jgi:cytoskeletal protein CcmA (bactofilin family)
MKFRRETEDEIISILSEGVEISGELTFNHGLRVDGIIKGKVRSDAFLVIGSKGRVEAEANVCRISINGEFRGVVHASDRIEIHKEGKVYGDVYTPCLIIEAGGLFEGKCNMSEKRAAGSIENAQAKSIEADRDSEAEPPVKSP